jgi:hypothetical protein
MVRVPIQPPQPPQPPSTFSTLKGEQAKRQIERCSPNKFTVGNHHLPFCPFTLLDGLVHTPNQRIHCAPSFTKRKVVKLKEAFPDLAGNDVRSTSMGCPGM